MKELNLTRPICFIDIESTGLNVEKDRIVELTVCKVHPSGDKEVKTKRFNPEIEISEEATKKHGLTNEDLKDEPLFRKLAKGILLFISDSDIAGYNSNYFDLPLLFFEFERAGVKWDYKKSNFIDIATIFKRNEERTLSAAYKFYCDKDLSNAHSAEVDTLATYEVFLAQLEKYSDLSCDMQELAYYCNYDKELVDITGKFAKNEQGEFIFNFGTHKGKKCLTELQYLHWMVEKGNFSSEVKDIAENILKENNNNE